MDPNSITHQQNNGQWIQIPLLIKKVVGNEFEFHYSLKKVMDNGFAFHYPFLKY